MRRPQALAQPAAIDYFGGLQPTGVLGADGFREHDATRAWDDHGQARALSEHLVASIAEAMKQYGAEQAYDWGLVNAVVPLVELEKETVAWCKEMLAHSPLALRMLKASHNAADDGLAGVQQLAGDATLLFYMTEEAQEGRDAYKEKREPNFGQFPKRP